LLGGWPSGREIKTIASRELTDPGLLLILRRFPARRPVRRQGEESGDDARSGLE